MGEVLARVQRLNEVETKLAKKTEELKTCQNEIKSMMKAFRTTLAIKTRKIEELESRSEEIEELESKSEENPIDATLVEPVSKLETAHVIQPDFMWLTIGMVAGIAIGYFIVHARISSSLSNSCTQYCEPKLMKFHSMEIHSNWGV